MKKLIILITLHASLFTLHVTEAQIIHIPADQPTIQAGIDSANDGDTVLVAEGTYVENINFMGKAIIVASHFLVDADTNHINNTIIDGSDPDNPDYGSTVTFITGEDTTSVLCGFTITGGSGMYESNYEARVGGGIVCYYATAKIIHNKIIGNEVSSEVYAFGGGIVSMRETGTGWTIIEDNTIKDNHSISTNNGATGGGIEIWGNARISNNIIEDNECHCVTGAASGGGVVMVSINNPSDTLKLLNNVIRNNMIRSDNSYAPGAGVYSQYSYCVISDNVVEYNEAQCLTYGHGGGIEIQYAEASFFSNTIRHNSIVTNNAALGGGVSCWYSKTYFDNNEVSNNSVDAYESDGGGIHFYYPEEIVIENNTISYNSCSPNNTSVGGGIVCFFPTAKTIFKNNEFTGNLVPIYVEDQLMPYSVGGGLVIWDADTNNVLVDGNVFTADTAKDGGGFFSRNSYNLELVNNVFNDNESYRGGAMGINHIQFDNNPGTNDTQRPVIVNNTLVENSGSNHSGAIWISCAFNIPVIFNSIFSGNSSPNANDIRNTGADTLIISYCNIDPGNIAGKWKGEGNINENPLFEGSDTAYFQLTEGSPCIDTGTPDTSGLYLPPWDLARNYRIWDGNGDLDTIIDIGAYEYGSTPIFPGIAQLNTQHSKLNTQTYPNPARGVVHCTLYIVHFSFVRVSLYNLQGQEVRALLDKELSAGEHYLYFDVSDLPDGIYFLRLTAGEKTTTQKLIITH